MVAKPDILTNAVVAIVPARDAEATIAATVASLRSLDQIDDVVVVDDGSGDGTGAAALAAGARVVRLPVNRGKGGAVAAGIAESPTASVYLLVDADLGSTTAAVAALLPPVLAGEADMTIAVPPSAAGRGGFGLVRDLARWGIARASGVDTEAPLSGQRAVGGSLLRSLALADRFGLETALTIDAARAGARIRELSVPVDHAHTGRGLTGFRHRAGQGVDIVRALWPRLTTTGTRLTVLGVCVALAFGWALWSGSQWVPSSSPATGQVDKVVLFGFTRLGLDDLGSGATPTLDRLAAEGAVAAASVRTLSTRPSSVEAYATLGAGTRVRADGLAATAFDANEPLERGTATDALQRRSGPGPSGEVVVVGAAATLRRNIGRHVSSQPGALGDALHEAGLRTAVVGNADIGRPGEEVGDGVVDVNHLRRQRPTAVALMTTGGFVDAGTVAAPKLLRRDRSAPFGLRASPAKVARATAAALRVADVVVVDPGDMDRAYRFKAVAMEDVADQARRRALRRTDATLDRIQRALPPRTLLLVLGMTPPTRDWELTPFVAVGPDVSHSYLYSRSTKRIGLVTLTDVGPTVLRALEVEVPAGMVGHALRHHGSAPDLGRMRDLNRDAAFREGIYFPLTLAYIILQALLYLAVIVAFSQRGGVGRASVVIERVVLAIAAWPLATFVHRAIPDVAVLGPLAVLLLFVIDAAIVAVACRARRHPLSPLSWILAATIALLVLDVCTGARLQVASLLGYSPHTAARFTGLGNTAFATLAATTVLFGATHLHYAPRRREALFAVAALFGLALLVDGAPPLGSDVGGIITLVPVFGLTFLVMSGRRLSWRALAAVAGVTVVVLGAALAVDLLRSPENRTHLGRLFDTTQNAGGDSAITTAQRKLATNARVFTKSIWTWAVPVIAILMVYLLVWQRGWEDDLPPGSALRAGVIGTVAAGLLGFAVNDSGVVVTALIAVYLGPFLVLLALHRERERRWSAASP